MRRAASGRLGRSLPAALAAALLAALGVALSAQSLPAAHAAAPPANAGPAFELLIRMADSDPATYAEGSAGPDPDPDYASLGAATALGEGRYAISAQALGLDRATFWGPLHIRARDGKLSPIGGILSHSSERDLAVLVAEPPADPGSAGSDGAGSGSDLIAASPGDSLELTHAFSYGLPNLSRRENGIAVARHDGFLPIDEARALFTEAVDHAQAQALSRLVESELVFPRASGCSALLENPVDLDFPFFAREDADGSWRFVMPGTIAETAVEGGGSLAWGGMFGLTAFSYRAAPGKGDEARRLLEDPGKALDIVLSGPSVSRELGERRLRILSMGRPAEATPQADRWSRAWLVASWELPMSDFVQTAVFMPRPDGFAGFMRGSSRAEAAGVRRDLVALRDFCSMSYSGSPSEWVSFLAERTFLPAFLADAEIEQRPEGSLSFGDGRFSIRSDGGAPASARLIKLTPWWFMEDGEWRFDSQAALLSSSGDGSWILLRKIPRPEKSASSELLRFWESLGSGEPPYDGSPSFSEEGAFLSESVMPRPSADPAFIYCLSARLNGVGSEEEARIAFGELRSRLSFSEGEIAAGGMYRPRPVLATIDGVDVFQAISAPREAAFSRFLELGEVLEARNANGDTPLLHALREGRFDFAQRLVRAGAGPDAMGADGRTPLLLAIKLGAAGVARELLRAGADPDILDPSGSGALALSMPARFGDLPELILAAGASPGAGSNRGALGMALLAGRRTLARDLIDAGFPLEARYPGAWTPLLYAALLGMEEEAFLLVEAGADMSARNEKGEGVLNLAARSFSPDALRRLMEADAGAKQGTQGE